MNKKDAVEKLCRIMRGVADAHDGKYAADCICHDKDMIGFCVEEGILDYIRVAVNEKLERDGLITPDIPNE